MFTRELIALVVGVGVVCFLCVGMPWLFGRAARPSPGEVLATAFERSRVGEGLVYLPTVIRSGELGRPEQALEVVRALAVTEEIVLRAVPENVIPDEDRALCLPCRSGWLAAFVIRGERHTPTIVSPPPSFDKDHRRAS